MIFQEKIKSRLKQKQTSSPTTARTLATRTQKKLGQEKYEKGPTKKFPPTTTRTLATRAQKNLEQNNMRNDIRKTTTRPLATRTQKKLEQEKCEKGDS